MRPPKMESARKSYVADHPSAGIIRIRFRVKATPLSADGLSAPLVANLGVSIPQRSGFVNIFLEIFKKGLTFREKPTIIYYAVQ